ncbi:MULTISPECIES: MoaD/ThiS family protein [Cytobacillus]|uniref:Molybdopterin synthase sulfur carrier subunit n=1 Tax=Cytobacillus oceanisediminis TaxID=665099 RepID=A0ABX3CJX9_9BACI|nr:MULTISPECIES: MoaD/ThiS family protein [Cytobacillus]OHX40713.1 hypothetical protein BBV17_29120 [Cytobacillus oceanisediminis]
MQIKTIYYGIFQEKAQKNEEIIETECENVIELYQELKQKYDFDLNVNEVLVAINDQYLNDLHYKLSNDDLVVFLHPMSGG